MMDQLWESIKPAIVSAIHAQNKKITKETLDGMRDAFMMRDMRDLFHPDDGVTTDVNKVKNKSIVLEIETSQKGSHYMGTDNHTVATDLTTQSEFPVYQIIFEDTRQKLIFEFVGDDHEKLKSELEKIYPGCTIKQSHDDYTIGKYGYTNYKESSNEFDKMQATLDKVDHRLAIQCVKKKLEDIDGTDRKATRLKMEKKDMRSDMVFGHISIHINIANLININDNHGEININNIQPTREELHQQWVEANPPDKGEKSSDYYGRVKSCVTNPLGTVKHAQITESNGYRRKKKSSGIVWLPT
jgi:hypothetical protein